MAAGASPFKPRTPIRHASCASLGGAARPPRPCPSPPPLVGYVLELGRARLPDPRICLLPTAGGDSAEQIFRFYAAFSDEACEPTHISLFRLGRRPVSLRSHLLDQDV